jgi:hypothetical protein
MFDGLSIARIRKLLRRDLDNGGPILLRALLLADRLILATPTPERGQAMLADRDALATVVAAVELILSGEHKVYTYHGGLIATVRLLVETARRRQTTDSLVSEVREHLRSRRLQRVNSAAAVLMALGCEPVLWPLAEALLAGKKIRQIANEQHLSMMEVIFGIRSLRETVEGVVALRDGAIGV